MEKLMGGDIANLMVKAVKSMRTTGRLEGRKWPKLVTTVVTMLSQFDSFDAVDGSGENSFGELGKTIAFVERALYKKQTKFPAMPAVERLWNLLCIFVRTNYFICHFNAKTLHDVQQSDDELGRMFEASLQSYIYNMVHPKPVVPRLYNEVFHTVVGGRPVDMLQLKDGISRMTQLITRKNHWLALWCVLCHHNLINAPSYEHFARQMMHRDWFAGIESRKRFTGDTLRECGYFTSLDYTAWNRDHYRRYRIVNNKVKWSESLCDNLLRVCISMEGMYEGA